MDNPETFIYLILFLGFCIYSTLKWYRNKEIQDLKAVDLKILAAENDLHFSEREANYRNKLERFDLQPGSYFKMKNILKSYDEEAAIRVFDASHIVGSGKSSRRIELVGISVESSKLRLPYFMLKSKVAFDGFKLFTGLNKVEAYSLPKSLQDKYSLLYSKNEDLIRVQNLFAELNQLSELLDVSGFHLFAGSKDKLVFYQNGVIRADLSHFKHLEQKGHQLFDMFRIDSDFMKKIDKLKKS
ncbi:MAG: hypothetical protein AB8G95_19520 [Anaerolineae bacterium]